MAERRCYGRVLPPNWHYLRARELFRIAYSVARTEARTGPSGAHGLLRCLSMPWGHAAARVVQSRGGFHV
ncbi:hypothetical protein [Lysobacter enzymogenes]|uniref:hypothetical protein n=1 Tax=Lysobacter enzymogenes TaxID=69 RepID=UPI001AF3CE64|nr:hypothetical protein [Lysobacter enzymogenes]QQQ03672.1 hypothetical protein JHW41_12350 [Lysobacter enzymogenes]